MNKYMPLFTITNEMLIMVTRIVEKIDKITNYSTLIKQPQLRKNKRIRSIHSSLVIEGNDLSLSQVENVINGEKVLGPAKEIQEVKNAYDAYSQIPQINPYSIKDLKRIHKIMGHLTVDYEGEFRKNGEGVFDGNKCIFMAPPADMVESLMFQLFAFIKENKNKIHPLILSSVFHYEFVFIHPFSDGNGRMVRLWQNVLLYHWKGIFEYLPIESQICKYQDEYYEAISKCHKEGNSNIFIEFMLKMIEESVDELLKAPIEPVNVTNINVSNLLDVMEMNTFYTTKELMQKLNIKSRITFRVKYLKPAISNNLIKMTEPNNETSKNQKYYKI
jgi:Fic family protein